MKIRNIGLIVFLVVYGVAGLVLLLDLFLLLSGQETISAYVWSTPALGLPILGVLLAGIGGLAFHFYAKAKARKNA
jgi:hypothetical protein